MRRPEHEGNTFLFSRWSRWWCSTEFRCHHLSLMSPPDEPLQGLMGRVLLGNRWGIHWALSGSQVSTPPLVSWNLRFSNQQFRPVCHTDNENKEVK